MKIDCHLHLPVREGLSTLEAKRDYLLEELQTSSIDYGIVIPDNLEDSVIGNLHQCLRLFENEKQVFLMATVNILRDPISRVDELDSLLKQRKIVGLKIFPGHDEHYPNDARLEPFVGLCLKHNTPFVVHTGWNSGNPGVAKWNDPKYIVDVASRHPLLKIVICHYFWPDVEYCYQVTRGYRNIYFDTSGLADKEVEDATGKERIKSVLDRTVGDNPGSLLLGSDFGGCDIASHVALVERLNATGQDKDAIFCRNAIDLFQLEISG